MRKIAFLVGNDTFPKDPFIPPLRFTQDDALELAAVLGDPETCAFETRLYLNRPSQEVLTDLDQISGELGQDDTLLFYYSGHGKLRGNELCLVSNETTTASLGATSIRTRLVLEYLQGSLARRRILILDCCHSGAIRRIYKAVDSKSTLDGLADSFGSYILTASTSTGRADARLEELGQHHQALGLGERHSAAHADQPYQFRLVRRGFAGRADARLGERRQNHQALGPIYMNEESK
jgi:uncharacterized caspase-like protein